MLNGSRAAPLLHDAERTRGGQGHAGLRSGPGAVADLVGPEHRAWHRRLLRRALTAYPGPDSTPVAPDEKIGGTVHLALGRITADGVTIQEDGRFA